MAHSCGRIVHFFMMLLKQHRLEEMIKGTVWLTLEHIQPRNDKIQTQTLMIG